MTRLTFFDDTVQADFADTTPVLLLADDRIPFY